jgi:PAS domain S-box-containing protein
MMAKIRQSENLDTTGEEARPQHISNPAGTNESPGSHCAAVAADSGGTAVFGPDGNLVHFNDRYVALMEVPGAFIRLGMSYDEILRYDADRNALNSRAEKLRIVNGNEFLYSELTLPSGNVRAITRTPLVDGGFVISVEPVTGRDQWEQKDGGAQNFIYTAIDNMADGIRVFDRDLKLVAFNEVAVELSMYPKHLFRLGTPIEEFLRYSEARAEYVGDPGVIVKRLKRIREGKRRTVEQVLPDGRVIRKARRPIPGGGMVSTYTDVTELRQAQVEASRQAHFVTTIMDNITHGIRVIGPDGTLLLWNKRYQEMFEYPDELLKTGRSYEEITRFYSRRRGDSATEIESRARRSLKRNQTELHRNKIKKYRDDLIIQKNMEPMSGGGFITTYTDITEHKLAEQEVVDKSRLLEATFQGMTQGIAVYDADQTLVAFNAQFAEITGLPSDYLHIGMNRRDIIRYRANQGHYGAVDVDAKIEERIAIGREPGRGERTGPHGRIFFYERMPIPDGGYIMTATDITERHEAEKQLQQAQKMEAVGQLTGGIAHDFNNLLAVSMGNVELAGEAAQSGGDVLPFLATAMRANERGASLTNQLLAFSRKQTLFPQVIDAGELVGGVTDLLRSSLGETIEINVASDDGIWPCEVDPHQLESAILNLAINARDAMPSGGTLTIGASNVSLDDDYAAAQTGVEPGDYVMVAVRDTGAGMPQDVIDHAFDPFFTTKEVGQGSGLGLSMVYGFAKQSGGHVTIYSEEGERTAVKLYLPRSDKEDEYPRQEAREDVPKARGETVLVVEDDPDVRALSVALLRGLGYQILEAADAETALKVLETAPRVNLLFSDVLLPGGMSGPELAAEVRSRYPGIAVLYTSGYTDLVGTDQSAFGEDAELLQKPYRKADLARTVRQILDQAQS